ncbi:dihydrodipicolinate synthase [Thermodesulfatator indicus DSM 15286]|uniref:4-hydroxy-tetrahydrodipicolinate synthase n=1 Tax=Thermodesulfatator indicus (strain DSM 15286 / JCM 11887 / CIR29812) TaxID=667014 RepID=F8A803_THEID|nr:4-hydroxy-tetrahydrodipicolinate synthase [Thermodesulfatator indicus]AEH44996.1 dihydrodipicolinate synthase [Thermodesulfatator indicus DSM 15286]
MPTRKCGRKTCKTNNKKKFEGAIVALITPFKDGKLDEESYRALVEWQIKQGIDGLLTVGTTGESPTLTLEEKKRLYELTVEIANGQVPVIAGTGTNDTAKTIEMTKLAADIGVDACLLVTPYYNKPSQEGLYQHYKAVAEAVKNMPLILYNVPSRTGVSLAPETVARLSKIKNIVAIKEATGCMKQNTEIVRLCGNKFLLLSGDDFTCFTTMALGGAGVISAAANVIPKEMANLMKAAKEGKWDKGLKLHLKLYPMFKALFLESNPVPAKTALYLMGKIATPEVRLPLAPMSEANLEKLKEVLKEYKLI